MEKVLHMEKARASRHGYKNVLKWMGIFSVRENNKEERYNFILNARKEMMDWDRKGMEKKLEIEREKIKLEKHEVAIKWELEKTTTFGKIELENKKLQIARNVDAKITLADEIILNEHAKKWLVEKKKINDQQRRMRQGCMRSRRPIVLTPERW